AQSNLGTFTPQTTYKLFLGFRPASGGGAGGPFFFPGKLEEGQIFNRALSSNEIATVFNAGTAGQCKPCTSLPTGLAWWWSGDGNANDLVGGNNGSLVNGATLAPGLVGEAFSFDGVDDRVDIADAPGLNPTTALTLMAWVNPTALTKAD